MPEDFDRNALAKLSETTSRDTSLRPAAAQPSAPMPPAEVSPRDAERIRAQQKMEHAVSKAQEANCGLNGSLKCNEVIGNEVRSQGVPNNSSHDRGR